MAFNSTYRQICLQGTLLVIASWTYSVLDTAKVQQKRLEQLKKYFDQLLGAPECWSKYTTARGETVNMPHVANSKCAWM